MKTFSQLYSHAKSDWASLATQLAQHQFTPPPTDEELIIYLDNALKDLKRDRLANRPQHSHASNVHPT